jgi:hypothetical protein
MPVKRRSVNRYFPRDLSRFLWFDKTIGNLEAMALSRMGKSQRLNLSQLASVPKAQATSAQHPWDRHPSKALTRFCLQDRSRRH